MNHQSQPQVLSLGDYAPAVHDRLKRWQQEDFALRLWEKDPTLWSVEALPELTDRLGWLDLPESMRPKLPSLTALNLGGNRVKGLSALQAALVAASSA